MLERGENYEAVYGGFRWRIPERINMGVDVCDKWAGDPDKLALIFETHDGRVENYSFAKLKALSNRFANALRALGVRSGDRIAVLLPQCPETAIAHIAAYKLGAIVMPPFTLFEQRLRARLIVAAGRFDQRDRPRQRPPVARAHRLAEAVLLGSGFRLFLRGHRAPPSATAVTALLNPGSPACRQPFIIDQLMPIFLAILDALDHFMGTGCN